VRPGLALSGTGAARPAAMSRLGLGCWAFGGIGSGAPPAAEAAAIIARAGELGVSHLDTATDYGRGASERIVGAAAAARPGAYFVASKDALRDTAAEAIESVEASLRRLGLASVDLYYIHWPRRGADPAPMMEGLEACRARGLLRFIGVSNFSVADMEAASRGGRIDYHELCWSLAWRRAEAEVVPYCVDKGIGIVAYSPLAQGLLTDAGPGIERWRTDDPRRETLFYRPELWPRVRPIVERMRALAARSGGLGSAALSWVLRRTGLSSALAGASSLGQLESNATAAASCPPEAALDEGLEALAAELDSVLPEGGNIFSYDP
jgi:myo-inositol catabolism protein IolS